MHRTPCLKSSRHVDMMAASVVQGKRFILKKTAYTAQYAQIYFTRLMQLTPVIKSRCQKEWPEAKRAHLPSHVQPLLGICPLHVVLACSDSLAVTASICRCQSLHSGPVNSDSTHIMGSKRTVAS